jgi:hypothetical protein
MCEKINKMVGILFIFFVLFRLQHFTRYIYLFYSKDLCKKTGNKRQATSNRRFKQQQP